MTIEQLEAEALGLSESDRARLAHRLIASLCGEDGGWMEDEGGGEVLTEAWYDVGDTSLDADEGAGLEEVEPVSGDAWWSAFDVDPGRRR